MPEHLTVRALQALERKPPPESREEIPDAHCPGLYLIRQPSGSMSWAVRYRADGKPRKLTLGPYPALGLSEARAEASKAVRAVHEGRDPGAEKAAARASEKAAPQLDRDRFKTVFEEFMKRAVRGKNRSADFTEGAFRVHVLPVWGERAVTSIGKRDVVELVDGIVDRGTPYMANRVFAGIRRLGNWCVERGILETSPCAGLKPPGTEATRDRVLSDDEIRVFWKGCDVIGEPFGQFFRLLLLTAQRRDEVACMRFSEVDGDHWTIPAERSKNGQPNMVPLSPDAKAVLATVKRIGTRPGFVFTTTGTSAVSGFSRAKDRLDAAMLAILKAEAEERGEDTEAITLQDWRLHDLRRTAATGMARLRIAPHVIEAVLNHRSGQVSGVAAVYNRYGYLDEKRDALSAWSAHVQGIVNPAPAKNVVPIRR